MIWCHLSESARQKKVRNPWRIIFWTNCNRDRRTRVVGLILASSFARHPMATLFAPIARVFDMKWLPSSIVNAALLGAMGTPELKARLSGILANLPRDIIR